MISKFENTDRQYFVDKQRNSRLSEHQRDLPARFKKVNVANSTKIDYGSGQNWILRQFRGEIKPSKHRFKPSEQMRRTSLQVGLSEVASLCVSNAIDILSHSAAYVMRFRN